MTKLREKIIRLAHANPELRKDLLPLLKQSAVKEAGKTFPADKGLCNRLEQDPMDWGRAEYFEDTGMHKMKVVDYSSQTLANKCTWEIEGKSSVVFNWVGLITYVVDIVEDGGKWIKKSKPAQVMMEESFALHVIENGRPGSYSELIDEVPEEILSSIGYRK